MAVDALETPVPVFLPPELLEVSLPGKIPFLLPKRKYLIHVVFEIFFQSLD